LDLRKHGFNSSPERTQNTKDKHDDKQEIKILQKNLQIQKEYLENLKDQYLE
jgi:hypothetical protein